MTPREQLAAIAAQDDDAIDLARAAIVIAQEEYPQLLPDPYLQRLDVFAERTKDRLANESAPLIVLQEVSRVLFEDEHFHGNTADYYDPRNSFLNDVLDRHTGIPLTLSIVYLEVGWRLGLPLEGVNFPGHFLVRYNGDALHLLADPYQNGATFFEDEAQGLLDQVSGGGVAIQNAHLRAANRRDMLVRMLANLKGIYLNRRDDVRAIAAIERILLLNPASAEDVRDYALALTRTGRDNEAVPHLHHYLRLAPDAADRARIELLLNHIGRAAN